MDLFLIRHAAAADGPLYGADAMRPLTAEGRRAARAVGQSLAQHGVKLDHIAVSPLVRAVETAELIAVSLDFDGELEVMPELAPEGSPHAVIVKLAEHSRRTALVGHLPSIGSLLGTLLGRPSGVSMSKMSVVRLGYADGRPAKLVWVMTPRHLQPVASLDAL